MGETVARAVCWRNVAIFALTVALAII